jgi:hypothetical protein
MDCLTLWMNWLNRWFIIIWFPVYPCLLMIMACHITVPITYIWWLMVELLYGMGEERGLWYGLMFWFAWMGCAYNMLVMCVRHEALSGTCHICHSLDWSVDPMLRCTLYSTIAPCCDTLSHVVLSPPVCGGNNWLSCNRDKLSPWQLRCLWAESVRTSSTLGGPSVR